LNLLRLSSRIDAVASRVETAVTMRAVTGNMTSVVRGMDKAMESMNLERVRLPIAVVGVFFAEMLTSILDIHGHG
jgi:charged multivesicular body protein 1